MTTKQFEKRVEVLVYVIIGVFLLLFGRLWYLQLFQGEYYARLAQGNRIRQIPVTAPRGIFYDWHRQPLVSNRLSYTVSIIPTALPADPNPVYQALGRILGQSPAAIAQEVNRSRATGRPFEPVRLVRDASPEIITRVEERRVELPGVMVEEMPVRNYLYGEFASHLFGYLGKISPEELQQFRDKGYRITDVIGKTGLERVYEEYLRGVDGGEQVEVDASGRPIRLLGFADPQPGNDLLLTLDLKTQLAAEKALNEQLAAMAHSKYSRAKAGAVVVLDPRSGAIRAMVSKPGYDPNAFVGGISAAELTAMLKNPYHPFDNRAIRIQEPPGSTFKLVTATAALELGKVSLADRFACRGIGPYGKKCWIYGKGRSHGVQNLVEGIMNSCNIVFYELGRRVGIEQLARYARMYGYGEPTGFDIYPREKKGLVPDPQWKRTHFRRADDKVWYPPETLDVAIGQGAVQATPLQVATAVAAVANNGILYRPYVVSEVVSPAGKVLQRFGPKVRRRLPFSPETFAIIKDGMRAVVAQGTARGAFVGFPIPVGGKTGTAQNSQGDDHAWFVGIAPIDKPEVVVVVFVEQGGSGSGTAAPVARKVLEAYFGVEKAEEQKAGR